MAEGGMPEAIPVAVSNLSFIPEEGSWQHIPASPLLPPSWLPVPIPVYMVGQQNIALFSVRPGLSCQVQDRLLGKLRSVISDPGFPSWTPCSLSQHLFPYSLPTSLPAALLLTSPGLYHTHLSSGNSLINSFTQACQGQEPAFAFQCKVESLGTESEALWNFGSLWMSLFWERETHSWIIGTKEYCVCLCVLSHVWHFATPITKINCFNYSFSYRLGNWSWWSKLFNKT